MARPQRLRDKTGPSWHGAWATEEGNLRVISLSLLKMNALLQSWQPRVALPQPAELGATLQPQGCPTRDRQHEMEELRLYHTVTVPWHVTLPACSPAGAGWDVAEPRVLLPAMGTSPSMQNPAQTSPLTSKLSQQTSPRLEAPHRSPSALQQVSTRCISPPRNLSAQFNRDIPGSPPTPCASAKDLSPELQGAGRAGRGARCVGCTASQRPREGETGPGRRLLSAPLISPARRAHGALYGHGRVGVLMGSAPIQPSQPMEIRSCL